MIHSIRSRIAFWYAVLILMAMTGLGLYLSHAVRQAHLVDLGKELAREARLVGEAIKNCVGETAPYPTVDALALRYATLLDARVTIIGLDGIVVGESHENRLTMDNHLYRPEVQEALRTGQGSSVRFSATIGHNMMYVAVPVTAGDTVIAVVRVALSLRDIEANVMRLRMTMFAGMVVTVLLSTLLGLVIANRTAQPVRSLTAVVGRMAEGDLDAWLLPTSADEVGVLIRSFNQMGDRLRETIATLAEEHRRLSTVLQHMGDGILIMNGEGRIELLNPAAERLLGTNQAEALARPLAHVAPHHQIIELWQRCRDRGEEVVEQVNLDRRGRFVQAIATPLREGEEGACLLVIQDLTEVRRLETVRRDFVSNVSHELRTPLASLKALVDTLRDGALEDPPAAQRFLDRIETEVDALAQTVQELLELSRIESGQIPLRLKPTAVDELVQLPIERLQPQAQRAEVQVLVDLPGGLPLVLADAERMHQVVTNLLHNAIKFTAAGGTITVSAATIEKDVVISVRDTGVGIPKEELPRVFERFYKVDRARSGGGTGLGLSIAKHIVQAHGGRIWVESTQGQGSTFSFSVPRAAHVIGEV